MSRQSFYIGYEISPIVLVNGIAQNFPGGMAPILQFLQPSVKTSIVDGIVTTAAPGGLSSLNIPGLPSFGGQDPYFAHFLPIPGASLIENDIGHYPFANQQTAANAIIAQELAVSLLMIIPANTKIPYSAKFTLMQALQRTLAQHIALGGWFTVATPTNLYANCLLRSLKSVGSGDSKQPQVLWQWDFEQPLLTLQQAAQVQSTAMSKWGSGTQVTPDANGNLTWSNLSNSPGAPNSGATTSTVPNNTGPAGQGSILGGLNSPSSFANSSAYSGLLP